MPYYGTNTVRFAMRVSLFCLVALILCYVRTTSGHELRIEHVTIVSPERTAALRDAGIKIEDDRITAIVRGGFPADRSGKAEIIDGRGLYVAPGLIDSHVHTADLPGIDESHMQAREDVATAVREQIPLSYLYFGYTTLIDLISTPEHAAAWNARQIRPDLYFCGGAQIPGGYPPMRQVSAQDQSALNAYMIIQRGEEGKAPQGIDPATHTPEVVVARMKHDGALCVKTFYERGFGEVDELPVPRLDTLQELVKAAHALLMPVFIHANGTDAQEFAVKAGADIIAHGMWHWNREQSQVELTPRARTILDSVLAARMGWQPTMQVLYGLQELFDPAYLSDPDFAHVTPAIAIEWYRSPPGQWYHDLSESWALPKPALDSHDPQTQWSAARDSYRPPITRNQNATHYMATHGARILFGTDTPSGPTYANPPGLNGWREMQHLVDAGMTPLQLFRAATQTNAQAVGLDRDIGTVESGKRANLLLLRADPTQNLQAYNQIVKVVIDGRVLNREDLAADRATAKP
jgi:imidazolonepropionase-like amidohydrolase